MAVWTTTAYSQIRVRISAGSFRIEKGRRPTASGEEELHLTVDKVEELLVFGMLGS